MLRHNKAKDISVPVSARAKVIDLRENNSRVITGLGVAMIFIMSLFAFSCADSNTVGLDAAEADVGDELSLPSVALNFDDAESYVDTGVTAADLGIEGDSPKTIEAWAYAREFEGNNNAAVFSLGERLSSAGEDFSLLALDAEDQWRMVLWNIDVDFSYPSKGRWVHFACVYTGSEMIVYADGDEVARAEREIDTSSAETLRFGHWHDDMGNIFNGMVTEVRVWDRALSSEEINANMGITLEGDEDGLTGYWPLDDGEGRTVRELTAGHTGEFVGDPEWADVFLMPFKVDLPGELEAEPGESITLGPVELRAPEGEVQYQWYLNDEPVDGATDNVLEITDISADHLGVYYVEANDGREKTPVKSARLNIPKWPEFAVDLPEEKEVEPGDSATLGPAELYDPRGEVTYQWYHNDEPLEGATESTLELADITSAELGIYKVVVDDDLESTPYESSPLELPYWPTWQADIEGKSPELGESVTLGPVELFDPHGEVTYQWYFNDEPIEGATEDILIIDEVSEEDYGTYNVVADDDLDITPVSSRYVRLLEPDRREVTFIHIGDTHYNARRDDFENQREMFQDRIQKMNEVHGLLYPDEVGGPVGRPMGVFIVGDLTESRQEDFDVLAEDWGLTGEDGLLDYPVYEGAGNHDGPVTTSSGGYVRRSIAERNPDRPHLASMCEREFHYSVDYDGVHFVQLNEYAGYDADERYSGNLDYNRKGQAYGHPAEKSLQFLEKTLEENVGDSGRPVILFQHYSIGGWALNAWGGDAWWTEEHVLGLWETIEGYNVIAVMVGHDHSHNINELNDIQFYHMDAVSGFAVYRIMDDEMVQVVRDPREDSWGRVSRQSISVNPGPPEELVQGPYMVYNDDPTEMTVLWRTSETSPATLRWGQNEYLFEAGEKEVEPYDEELNLYRATVTDLEPNTGYTYQLQIGDKYDLGMFYSAPEPDAEQVKFMFYGSTAEGFEEQEKISRALYDHMYDDAAYHSILVHTGKWVPQIDSMEDWDNQFFSRETDAPGSRSIHRRIPLMGAMGEREEDADELFERLFPYNYADGPYHSFQYGPVHVTVMDAQTDYSPDSDQYQWLASDLEDAEAPWKVLVYSGEQALSDDSEEVAESREILEPLLQEKGVHLVVDGGTEGYLRDSIGDTEYVGLGAGVDEEENSALYFGALQVEGGVFQFEILDDTGGEVDVLEL